MRDVLHRVQGGRSVPVAVPSTGEGPSVESLSGRLGRLTKAFDFPDRYVLWIPLVVAFAWWRLRGRGVDVIQASGPEFSVCIAGILIAKMLRVPVVSDFRDPWIPSAEADPYAGDHVLSRPRLLQRFERWIERWVVMRSDHVTFTSHVTHDRYRTRYPVGAGRMSVILNGVDLDDVPDVEPFPQPTIAHVGTVHAYQHGQAELLIEAFAEVARCGPTEGRLVFVGHIARTSASLEALAERLGVADRVIFTGELPHSEALAWTHACHVQVILMAANREIRFSKLSQYLAAPGELVAIGPREGETGREVLAYGGSVIESGAPAELAQALEAALKRALSAERPRRDLSHPHPANRRTNAHELAAAFASVCP